MLMLSTNKHNNKFHRSCSIIIELKDGWCWQGPLPPSGPTPAPAGTPKAGCPGPHPGNFCRSSRKRLHSLWTACASALSPAQHKSAAWCSEGTSSAPVCASSLGSFSGHHWKEPGSNFFAPSLHAFKDINSFLSTQATSFLTFSTSRKLRKLLLILQKRRFRGALPLYSEGESK